MRRAYIAGPMRGYRLFNFPAFLGTGVLLRRAGWDVVCPAEHDLVIGFDPTGTLDGFDLRAALRWDIDAVLRSDAVVALPGWQRSSGASAEVAAARAAEIPVLTPEEALALEAES